MQGNSILLLELKNFRLRKHKYMEKLNNMKSFVGFLEERHIAIYPSLLDDDIPDNFNNWLGNLETDDLIEYATLFGHERYLDGKREILEAFNK